MTRFLALLLMLLVAGCAYVTAKPLKSSSDTTTEGIRVYDIKPILVVSNQTVEVKLIPNADRAYAIQFGAFLAKNDVTLELENTAFKKITANMDSTRFIEFLENLGKAAIENAEKLGALGGETRGSAPRSVWVYDFVFDGNGNIKELRPLIVDGGGPPLNIPVPPRELTAPTPENTDEKDKNKPNFDG